MQPDEMIFIQDMREVMKQHRVRLDSYEEDGYPCWYFESIEDSGSLGGQRVWCGIEELKLEV